MCGIFGYTGKRNATELVLTGLKRLDYRGHDSWGIGVIDQHAIKVDKHAGKVSEASPHLPKSFAAIGHTRWATHGAVNDINAHPHFSSDNSFIVAQNGIVENYEELKKLLRTKGYKFETETDTEVIVRLIEDKLKKTKDLTEATRLAFKELDGRNTAIVLSKDGEMIAARNGSPMVVGINGDEQTFFSSDALSFAPLAKKMVVLDNGQLVRYKSGQKIEVFGIKSGKRIPYRLEDLNIEDDKVDKESFDHFMMKEISEAPFAISRLLKQEKKDYEGLARAIQKARSVYTIGSGTAGAAASQIAFYLRRFGQIPARDLIGVEATEYLGLFTKDDLIIAPSQSGETADVLEVLEKAKKKGVKIASFVNMPGSMITRMSDFKFMAQAGPEICVMTTKVFVSQIAWGYLVAKTVQRKFREGSINLEQLASEIENYLSSSQNHKKLKSLAEKLSVNEHIFLLGKGQNLQIIREGMIKIIEGAYIHAHAIPSGDLKHYAITLMEEGVPVIAVLSNDPVKKEVINAVYEVKARGASVIGIAPQKEVGFDEWIPVPDTGETSAISNIIPLQLLGYYMAVSLGNNVDKPRNIAKSVTVK